MKYLRDSSSLFQKKLQREKLNQIYKSRDNSEEKKSFKSVRKDESPFKNLYLKM